MSVGTVPAMLSQLLRWAGYKVKDDSAAVTARKVVQLFQLPRVLVLHLKRFSYTLNGTGKIHKPIHYGERLRCAALFLSIPYLAAHVCMRGYRNWI